MTRVRTPYPSNGSYAPYLTYAPYPSHIPYAQYLSRLPYALFEPCAPHAPGGLPDTDTGSTSVRSDHRDA